MDAIWPQNYDPLGHPALSTAVSALPIVILLGSLAFLRIRIHISALLGLAAALAVALFVYRMPAGTALASGAYGAAFGLFPIGWIILNVMFLYYLTVERGLFDILRKSIASLAPNQSVQLILVAFAFGAFIEGVAGFGTPVAITGAILIQLGFKPLHASGLALIANTAPVAFGSLGIPITTLEHVTGISALKLSSMVGRQLPVFSLVIPFWVVAAHSGWRGMLQVWPAALTAGLAFAIPQCLISNLHGPWLVDTISAVCSMGALAALLRFWKPPGAERASAQRETAAQPQRHSRALVAWLPWIILTLFIIVWGVPAFRAVLDKTAVRFQMPYLHNIVERVPPVGSQLEKAEFTFNFLSATGTGILLAGIVSGFLIGYDVRELARVWLQTVWKIRWSLLTITAMLALGNVTKYSGEDATLGLALARTGVLYPFFGTLLGWLGVALTGSDTASNVLFGSLQTITAQQTGLSPVLMSAANSSGGVMGKMIDAQSIVVASTATNFYGEEGKILRFVFIHSLILAILMGILVFLQAYVAPFSRLIVK
ncbi:MAG TPA: L-lactate permease [Verrucomicrobiae bacterium]|nr:L-lactate permease [Verrucomicrobiae bacterium]